MGALLVGRESESLALDAALADAASATHGVLVTGEAGIGKTALVRAFLDRADARGALTVACGGLPAGGPELPYAPVVQLLRSLRKAHLGALDAALGPQARSLVATLVPDLFPGDSAAVPPAGRSSTLQRSLLLTGVAGIIDALTRDAPVVVVVEDVQWVDGPTLALLGMLLRGSPDEGLLLVVTAREPGLPPQVRRWCAIERAAGALSTLRLPPLTVAETALLLAELGPEKPSPARAAEVARLSGGNPFLVRELSRVGTGAVPESVRDIVGADLDELSTAARRVVAAVAVAGRPIEHALLADVVGRDTAADGAAAAVDTGMLDADRETYRFGHELSRAAVDEAILPGDRLSLHASLATALASRVGRSPNPGDLAEIAWHFEQAGAGADLAEWALRAAAAAERVGAFAATLHQLERALAVADTGQSPDDHRLDLMARAAVAADRSGDHPRALHHVDTALALVDPEADPEPTGRLLGHRAWLLLVLGRLDEGCAAAEEAVRLAPPSAGLAQRATALLRLARAQGVLGRSAEARATAAQAHAAALAVGDDALLGRAMLELGWLQPVGDGPRDHGLELLEGAWQRGLDAGEVEDLAQVGVLLSDRLMVLGRLEEAASAALDAHDAIARLAEGRHWADTMLVGNASQTMIALGRWDEAAALLEQACTEEGFAAARLARAQLRVARGELDQADDDLRDLQSMRDRREWGLEYDEILADLRLWQQRPRDALDGVRAALAAIGEDDRRTLAGTLLRHGMRAAADLAVDARIRRDDDECAAARSDGQRMADLIESLVRADPGLTAATAGELGRADQEAAPAAWAEAARVWSADHRPYNAAYARWRHAEALLDAGASRAQAEPSLRAAAEDARRLGAAPLLAEVEALAQRARVSLTERVPAQQRAVRPSPPGGLSERELAVLRQLVLGRTNREIARELYMSPSTAGVHVSHLMRKLGVRSRVQAAAVAHRLGIEQADTAGDAPTSPRDEAGKRHV